VKVLAAEAGRRTIGVHQTVERIDVLHVKHSTKPTIFLNIILRVHPAGGIAHECLDSLHIALVIAIEILPSELSKPNGQVEGIVPVLDILYEAIPRDIIPMSSNDVDTATTIASGKEILHPSHSVGVRTRGSRHKGVPLRLQGLHIGLPHASGSRSIDIGLARFIGLVEEQCIIGIASDDSFLEGTGIGPTPELGSETETKGSSIGRSSFTPSVDKTSIRSLVITKIRLVSVGPSETGFSRTRTRVA